MRVGTKSVLFGVHNPLIHFFFVFRAWRKLYGWPSLKTMIVLLIHDFGYFHKPNMDGEEGESHPLFAHRLLKRLGWDKEAEMSLYHSRFWAKKNGAQPSRLCYADKLASALYPVWLYRILGHASGEIHEYMMNPKHELCDGQKQTTKVFMYRYRGIIKEWLKRNEEVRPFAERWNPRCEPYTGGFNA